MRLFKTRQQACMVVLQKNTSHNTSRDDSGRFYSYGHLKEKSTLLHCTMKHLLPNIFHCTAFKKHHGFIFDENRE